MTYEEAQAELNDLRGLDAKRQALVPYERVSRLYTAICRKPLRRCNCKDIISDALIEIYAQLSFYKSHMELFETKARLVNGVVLQHNNKHYTNINLTDEVAREFLALHPNRKDWFATLPDDVEQKEVKKQPRSRKPRKKVEE